MPEGSRPAHQPRHPGSSRRRGRTVPKGRQIVPSAQEDVRALLGDAPRRRDLLIEFLHLIQDRYGYLSAAHLMALADELRMAQAEVYEVATFYAHFDVVKEGETPPPPLTVRVCESLSCKLAGAEKLIADLQATTGSGRARRARAVRRPLPHRTGRRGRASLRRSCRCGDGDQGDRRASPRSGDSRPTRTSTPIAPTAATRRWSACAAAC